MIGIIDYGLGNLTSVAGAVEKVGFELAVSGDASVLGDCDKLILPGVGAFGDGMDNLRDRGLVEPLTEMVTKLGKPILGICLGFQLLARKSEEFGNHEGLRSVDNSLYEAIICTLHPRRSHGYRLKAVGAKTQTHNEPREF